MPTTISTLPSVSPFLTCVSSLAGIRREACATLTGKPRKRSAKFLLCCRASSVVGTTTATCLPSSATANAARSATSVLPKPTSPQISRSIGRPLSRSFSVDVIAPELVLGFLIGEARAELVIDMRLHRHFRRFVQMPLGRDLDQFAGDLADAVLELGLARLPAAAAQPVQFDIGVVGAVARQQFDVFDRQEQLCFGGIMQFETVMRRAADLDASAGRRSGRCRARREPRDRRWQGS